MLTGARGEGVYWALSMSSPTRRPHERNNQSPVPSGFREPQIILLLCGLDHLVKTLGVSSLIQRSTWVWAVRWCQFRKGLMDTDGWKVMWRWGTKELACVVNSMQYPFVPLFSLMVFILRCDFDGTLHLFRFVQYIHIYEGLCWLQLRLLVPMVVWSLSLVFRSQTFNH